MSDPVSYTLPFDQASGASPTPSSSTGDAAAAQYAGVLRITTANTVYTCTQSDVSWMWIGSSLPSTSTVSVAVQAVTPVDVSARRLQRLQVRNVSAHRALYARDGLPVTITSSVPLNSGGFHLDSMTLPPGTYRWIVRIPESGTTGYSNTFTVAAGQDTSCVPDGSTASSSTSSSMSVELPTSTPVSVASTPLATSALASTPAASSPSSASSSNNAAKSSSGGGTSAGTVAAAVIVPLLFLIAIAIVLVLRRRGSRASGAAVSGSSKPRSGWSEKFLNSGAGPAGAAGEARTHKRDISAPMNAIHAAGTAMHESNVRSEMRRPSNIDTTVPLNHEDEHWVSFSPASSPDAAIVNTDTLAAVVAQRAANDTDDEPQMEQLYSQANIPLSALPSRRNGGASRPATADSQPHAASFGEAGTTLSRSASTNTPAASGLQRSTSNGSILNVRRKPVPAYRKSEAPPPAAQGAAQQTNDGYAQLERGGAPVMTSPEPHGASATYSPAQRSSVALPITPSPEASDSPFDDSAAVPASPALREAAAAEAQEELVSPRRPFAEPAHRSSTSSGQFPASVHSDAPAAPSSDEPRPKASGSKDDFKLDVDLGFQDDRGFRISF